MEFTVNFSLESDVDSEDWVSDSQTRSMRHVAYMAYNTPGTEAEPNAGYQNPTLLNYFSKGDAQKMYAQATVDTAFMTDTACKAYIGAEDVTAKTASALFEGETLGSTKTAVVFDQNNVAYDTTVQYVTQTLSTPSDVTALLDVSTATDRDGYYVMTDNITVDAWTNDGGNLKLIAGSVFDGNGYTLTVPRRQEAVFGILNGTLQNINIVLNVGFDVTDNNPSAFLYGNVPLVPPQRLVLTQMTKRVTK